MSKEIEKVNSSDVYRKRFVEYGQIYIESCPEPPDPMMGNAGSGAMRSAVKRNAIYNNKDNQNKTPKTGG